MLLLLTLLACSDKSGDTSSGGADSEAADAGGDSGGDSGDVGDAGGDGGSECEPLSSGTDWAWDGECPMMETPCDIVVEGCSFSIDYDADGGMTMGMPYSGTLSGTTVTFADDNTVDGCVGEILGPDLIEGTCEGGCTFTLRR